VQEKFQLTISRDQFTEYSQSIIATRRFQVPGSRFRVQVSGSNPERWNENLEPEPRTWNLEPGTLEGAVQLELDISDAQSAALSNSFTRVATCVPYSSMLFICASWGSVPLLYFRWNRLSPSARMVAAIFFATVAGDPT